MNPDADKSHVPNAQNEVVKEERLLREHLAREFLEKKREADGGEFNGDF